MTRSEFMDSLHRALAGSLTSSTVNENMRYYEEYFDTQIRSGQSEEENYCRAWGSKAVGENDYSGIKIPGAEFQQPGIR